MSDPNGPWQRYGQHSQGFGGPPYRDDGDDPDDGGAWSLRTALGDAVWRYRSAPLWARVVTDIAAASLVLVVIVVASLALRPDRGPREASAAADAPTTTSSTATTSTTVATTTTTVATTTTTTTVATTTTAEPTTTTTTAPPVVPPPTQPPPTAPPTTEPWSYRNCREVWRDDALPLFTGDPGYGPHLDEDGDGEACEWDDEF